MRDRANTRKGTKKSCRGIEQVREAGRRKIKPFLLENDPEKILGQCQSAVERDKNCTKLVLVSRETLLYLDFNKPNKQHVSEINPFKKILLFPVSK